MPEPEDFEIVLAVTPGLDKTLLAEVRGKAARKNNRASRARSMPSPSCRGWFGRRRGCRADGRALAAGAVPGYASGMVGEPSALCGFDGEEPVVDPMCRSGTFVIEAAEMAMRLNPGRLR